MDSLRETFRAATSILEPLLCRSDGQANRTGPSILEQMFPVRKALSRVPLLEDNPMPPALPPPILPNPLKSARQQLDGNTGKPPLLTAADNRKTPPGTSSLRTQSVQHLSDIDHGRRDGSKAFVAGVTSGETTEDWYSKYKHIQPALQPGTTVACTAVFLDPSFRKTMLEWYAHGWHPEFESCMHDYTRTLLIRDPVLSARSSILNLSPVCTIMPGPH